MSETAELICPKCHGTMRSYERSGVIVDQCDECRGIFLDRGELKRLIDAEAGDGYETGGHDRDDEDREHASRGDHRREKRSRTSFITDLLGGE